MHYIARHGESRVAKAAILSAVPPLMVKTAANPDGLPKAVFDDLQAQLAANRSKFYYDLPAGPFYGYNRPGAKPSETVIWNWWRQGMMGGAKAHYDGIVAFSQKLRSTSKATTSHRQSGNASGRASASQGDDTGYADLRSYALEVRIFTLQNLDRWPDAELALQRTREFAQRSGNSDRATWATAAVLRYWLGQWDDALAELGPDDTDAPGLTYSFLRERWSALLWHGVSALIAGRREERTLAGQRLRQGLQARCG